MTTARMAVKSGPLIVRNRPAPPVRLADRSPAPYF